MLDHLLDKVNFTLFVLLLFLLDLDFDDGLESTHNLFSVDLARFVLLVVASD